MAEAARKTGSLVQPVAGRHLEPAVHCLDHICLDGDLPAAYVSECHNRTFPAEYSALPLAEMGRCPEGIRTNSPIYHPREKEQPGISEKGTGLRSRPCHCQSAQQKTGN